MRYNFEDCYANFDGNTLIVGNAKIERVFALVQGYPISIKIQNKETGHIWESSARDASKASHLAVFNLPFFDFSKSRMEVTAETVDNGGLSLRFLQCIVLFTLEGMQVKWELNLFPELPFLSTKLRVKGKPLGSGVSGSTSPDNNTAAAVSTGIEKSHSEPINKSTILMPVEDTIDAFGICDRHVKLQEIRFYDRTDEVNTLVKKSDTLPYTGRLNKYSGNMFMLNSYLKNEAILITKDGFTHTSALNRTKEELYLKPSISVEVTGTGLAETDFSENEFVPCYGCTLGVGNAKSLKESYKDYYNAVYAGDRSKSLFIMSNTWGDRNQDKAVCEEFMLREIELAEKLGVDIVQIDDGWQKGITANSALAKGGVWEGYYAFDPDFWNVNSRKFPNGLEPLVKSASEKNIKLALWFSPDSSRDFANWEKDAEVLISLYEKYGITYFKLDGIKIRNKQCEINLIKLLKKVTKASRGAVSFNMDITAQIRFGYFYEKQFGTIFVENRYTDWGNYYPHYTLRNAWSLSEFLPLRKFQFEVLNNKRNISKYAGDPLAPSNYTMDYIFAATMFSNPLIWMEMSNLQGSDVECLSKIIKVYKKEREKLFAARIRPIGQMPDGTGFTGFQAIVSDTEGYLLLFREFSESDSFVYELELANKCNMTRQGNQNTSPSTVQSKTVSETQGKTELRFENLYSSAASDEIMINGRSIDSAAPVVLENCRMQVSIARQAAFVFLRYQRL